MKKILFALLLALLPSIASAQCSGVFPQYTVCGNSGAAGVPHAVPSSSIFPIAMVDAGSSSSTLVLNPSSGTLTLGNGIVISFRSIISGPTQLTAGGATVAIRDPNGTATVIGGSATAPADIKKGSSYFFRYNTTDQFGNNPYWQIITPPYSTGQITPPLTAKYMQNDGTLTGLTNTFVDRVYNTDAGRWDVYPFNGWGLADVLCHNCVYVDGVLSTLTTGAYYVYEFSPPGTGHLGIPGGVAYNFVNRYFTNDTTCTGACPTANVTITGTSFVTSAETGTIKPFQTLSGGSILTGTYATTYNSGSHSGTVNRSQSATAVPASFAPAKYVACQDGTFCFVDGQGNMNTLLGILYVQSATDIKSYFTRSDAWLAGVLPGNTIANNPFSSITTQPLGVVTTAPVTAGVTGTTCAGGPCYITGNTLIDITDDNGSNTAFDELCVEFEWHPDCSMSVTGWASNNTSGEGVNLQISITGPIGALSVETVIVPAIPYISPTANQKVPVQIPRVAFPGGDGAYVYKIKGSISRIGTLGSTSLTPNGKVQY